jgi:hypothetical protein
MVRFYLCPMEAIVTPRGTFVRPKYIFTLGITLTSQWMEMNDYGNELLCLLALDVTPAQHAAMIAHTDVSAFPVDLDSTPGANLATVKAAYESRNLPADDVTANTPYRIQIRWIIAIFSITTKDPLFSATVTLDTTLGQLTAIQRAELKAAAESADYSTAGLTLQSTIRQALNRAVTSAGPRRMLGVDI